MTGKRVRFSQPGQSGRIFRIEETLKNAQTSLCGADSIDTRNRIIEARFIPFIENSIDGAMKARYRH